MQGTLNKIVIMNAYVDGKRIDVKSKRGEGWTTLSSAPIWNWEDSEYRITPVAKKLLAYLDEYGELRLKSAELPHPRTWARIPSEDKTICL